MQLIKWLFGSSPRKCNGLEIVEMKHFPFKGYLAMSWCGRLITKSPQSIDEYTLNHETIHLKQAQRYRFWICYYIVYLWEWLKGNPFAKPRGSAYYTIPFEVEAYANEGNLSYVGNYDKRRLKEKYRLKKRKALFREHGSITGWMRFIEGL